MYIDGGNRSKNNYDCQNIEQVLTGVPIHIKHVFTGVPKIPNDFQLSKQSPHHSKDLSGTLIDLETQIFQV